MPLTFDEPKSAGLTFDDPTKPASKGLTLDKPSAGLTFDSLQEPEESSAFEQVKEIPKSLVYGAADAYLGAVEGSERAFAQMSKKFGSGTQAKYDELVSRGEQDSWKAGIMDSLTAFHKGSENFWLGKDIQGGADYMSELRNALAEKMEPTTQGFISDVARGVGGMATLPLDVSGAGVITIGGRMFDEGLQTAQAEGFSEAEQGDIATAYMLAASPVELIGDLALKRFGGKATARGVSSIAKQALKKMGLNFVSEGSTEVLQDAILNKLTGQKMFTPESLRTFLVSGTVGTIVSGGVTIGGEVKIAKTNKYFETMGLTPEDAQTATQMVIDGNIDGATEFVNSKNPKLTDIIEAATQADAEIHPLTEQQAVQLENLAKKDVLTGKERADLDALKMDLDSDDQAIIDDYIARVEGSSGVFSELITRLKNEDTLSTPEEQKAADDAAATAAKINQQEAQDDTKRKQTDGTEQESKATETGDTGTISQPDDGKQVAGQEQDGGVEGQPAGKRTPEDSVGISIERMNVVLEELGFPLLGDVTPKSLQAGMDNAIASGQVDTIEELAIKSALGGDVQFNEEQVLAAGARMAQMETELEIIGDKLEVATDSVTIEALRQQESVLQVRLATIMGGLRTAVTPSARAVQAMGAIINRQDYSVKSMLQQAIKQKGGPLTPEEVAVVTEASNNVRKQQAVVKEGNKKERKKVSLADKIKELQENVRFMKRTIEKRKGKKAPSNDQKRLAELRQIENQQNTIAQLLTVLRNRAIDAKNKRLVNDPEGYIDTISNLRKEIRESKWYKDLQNKASKDERKAQQLADMDAKLDVLESQHAGKYRNIPEKKDAKVADADIKALRDSIREVEQLMQIEDQIADLDEQLRTGVFKAVEKKITHEDSQELKDAKRLLSQKQREARDKIYSLRSLTKLDKLKEWATLPRSLMATADMSYGLRQGILPSVAHPVIAAQTWGKAFKAFFSQNTADEIDVAMREDPLFDDMVGMGVHFSSMDSAINNRTEFFASNLAEKIPGFGSVVRASERNMVTGINMLRYGIMKDFMVKHPDAPEDAQKAFAKYLNVATGRGEAKFLDSSAELLSLALFAPRFAVSRVQAPGLAIKNMIEHPELRKELVTQWAAYLGTGLTVLALAKLAGAEVEDDPEDSDWGKIVVGGNKHIDIWGGIQQPMRLAFKAMKGGYQQAMEGETDVNPMEDMWRFLSYKLSPPVQMVNELVSGQDVIGRETENIAIGDIELPTAATVLVKNMTPLILQSVVEATQEGESAGPITALALGEGLGLSIGVYDKD